MKKMLNKIANELYYYKNNKKIIDIHKNISGNVSELTGDVSELTGDVSWIRGNVSKLTGDVSELTGNVDLCEITEEEREEGIDVKNLII